GARQQLSCFWTESEADLLACASEQNQWEDVQDNLPRIRKGIQGVGSRSRQSLVRVFRKAIMRWKTPTGFWVVILGPDGCGKSAVLEAVRQQLAPAPKPGFFRHTATYHLKPALFDKPGGLP